MLEQQKQYATKIKTDQNIDKIRQKMRDIRKDITEANEIAKFMNKDLTFTDIYVSKFEADNIYSQGRSDIDQQDEVQVKVENYDTGAIHIWSADKFQDKLVMMRDALQVYEQNDFADLAPEQDPFAEKQEPILLGQAFYMLEGLAYLMDNPRTVPIVATNNKIYGQLEINLVPCDEDGNEDIDEDLLSDDPADLKDQSLTFKVKISRIANLPEDFCRNIYCEYGWYLDKEKYRTPASAGPDQNPEVNFVRQHHVDCVSKLLLDYLLEDKMTIKVFGEQEIKKKKPGAKYQSSQKIQIQGRSRKPMYSGTNLSDEHSKQAGVNSTMNSSISSQNSGKNYKVQG